MSYQVRSTSWQSALSFLRNVKYNNSIQSLQPSDKCQRKSAPAAASGKTHSRILPQQGMDMEYTGYNLNYIKMANRSRILYLLNDKGPMARKDIAAELGLTAAAVTQICSELLSAGILRERGEVSGEKHAGRKKVLVGLDYDYAYVLEILIEIDDTTVTISNLHGKRLRQQSFPTDSSARPFTFLMKCANLAGMMMEEEKLPIGRFLGCGVSIPGLVQREQGISLNTFRIWNERIDVRKILKGLLGMPIVVENNVRACAEAELLFGEGRQNKNLFFLKWGPGVGSAIVINNEIYDNRRGMASEFGHVVIHKNGGKLCRCGKRGCLETEVSTHAIVSDIRGIFSKEKTPLLWQFAGGDVARIQVSNRATWMALDDPGMNGLLQDVLEILCFSLSNAVTVLSPDELIYYGDLFTVPYIRDHFEETYQRMDPSYEKGLLVHSMLSDQINYIGALAIVYKDRLLNQV
jgi:transcriptional regulator of PTS gene